MKAVIVSCLLLGGAAAAHAQTAAGSVLLGGGIGYTSTAREYTLLSASTKGTDRLFRLAPMAGYFVADNLVAGLSAELNRELLVVPVYYYTPGVGEIYSEYETRTSSNIIGPFARYYQRLGDKIAFYGQLTTGYRRGRIELTDRMAPSFGERVTTITGFAGALMPGFVFFPSSKLGVELTLGALAYSDTKEREVINQQGQLREQKEKVFSANFGLQRLNVGAFFYLGGK